MHRGISCVLALAACGRFGFDPARDAAPGAPGDAGPPIDANIPAGLRLWLEMETDPMAAITDTAGGHVVTCDGACPKSIAGIHGNGFQFNGQQLRVTYRADLDVSAGFTVAIWMMLDLYSAECCSCAFTKPYAATDQDSFALCVDNPSHVAYVNTDTAVAHQSQAAQPLPLATWHHFAVTWDTTKKIGYFDGVAQGTDTPIAIASDTDDLVIGADNGNGLPYAFYWHGALDDVRFYDRVLGATEIQQLATP